MLSKILELVDNVRGQIEMPEISDPYLRIVWCMGRNAGANKVRMHVRRNINEKLPYLKSTPKALRHQLGQTGSNVWLSGYNASIEYVERKINVMMFYATQGQVMVAQLNK